MDFVSADAFFFDDTSSKSKELVTFLFIEPGVLCGGFVGWLNELWVACGGMKVRSWIAQRLGELLR